MAKRSRTGGRPGQRRPLQRPQTRPDAPAVPGPRPAGSVTPEEEARAAELEAAIIAQERAAEEARRSREKARRSTTEGVVYSSVPLAVRAAEEYGYVVRDVRRIARIGGLLLALLLVLHLLVNVLNVL